MTTSLTLYTYATEHGAAQVYRHTDTTYSGTHTHMYTTNMHTPRTLYTYTERQVFGGVTALLALSSIMSIFKFR